MPLQHHSEEASGPRRIAVTGSSGFVGCALVAEARSRGMEVLRMVRRPPTEGDEVQWDPERPFQADPRLEGIDAVIHLAGAGVAEARWTRRRRQILRTSRVDATGFMAEALQSLKEPPTAFVQASAIGFYGDRGDEVLTEQASGGAGFLADLVRDWEDASGSLAETTTRTVQLRIGMVIGRGGGAVAQMRPIFRLGLGGRLGSGSQWISWIALADLIEVLLQACRNPTFNGPINAASPAPLTNTEFTHELARALHRPALLPVPAPLLRLTLGRMAGELLLASQRCDPLLLREAGYQFRYPCIQSALSAACPPLA
ncbi:MAG: TIGR01777 family protein [Planctomycetes bacterium]|jgi:uncharacterized protein (TIGR01777 family)|nr:TIGR01777 family protein [Planctomycetota bacterium]MCP4838385.1 TIGR01777 family protein [Planctomycetota bacterium]